MNQCQIDFAKPQGGAVVHKISVDEPSERARAELHVHMNGAIPLSTIKEILADELTELPPSFSIERDMSRRTPCQSLASYLTPWQVLRLFPKKRENLDRLCWAVFSRLAQNNVRLVELRSSVLYLATLQQCSPAQALERLIESYRAASNRFGMRFGLILTVTRGDYSSVSLSTLLKAYQDLGEPSDVVGLDLAGDEEISYPAELPSLFRKAKDRFGLGVTIHAGETGRVENVRAAMELFDADRIGHGTAASKDPHLLDILAKQDICIEVCPISNRLTGAVPVDEAHPLLDFKRHEVPFVICSDNPEIHQQGLADDHAMAMTEGLSANDIYEQFDVAKRYSFIEGLD
ncbi:MULTISPECIES: adenosine deaminase [Pseudomonas]|uniref:Adenosine deaminase n=1 Tax=Pseudomonas juntendi TaxID=2666183 RepID=A0A7W2QY50_9PSED|nr:MULTISPECIES: adenosine deaminase [Pseudomonas]MBA6131729.1 adenosine deaminase [Pseudomonas juntendi]MBA6146968.1 adenosine deaminase [Pseudomonas juntendi]MCK2110557.1 adenosine deaminase [Pseudomonas juntendi]MCK2115328.1 adenosine deaminase [Pseudomonas juntendi]MDG9808015.1 adenosine deaminase [Pseudomonas juntendi]